MKFYILLPFLFTLSVASYFAIPTQSKLLDVPHPDSLQVSPLTYYFSTTDGDDSRTSTQAQNSATPWKTLSKLNSFFSSLNAGDRVLFKRGDVFVGGKVTISKSGSSGGYIYIGAYGTSTSNPRIQWDVANQTGNTSTHTQFYGADKSYIYFENLTFSDTTLTTTSVHTVDSVNCGYGIDLDVTTTGSNNNVIQNCVFERIGNAVEIHGNNNNINHDIMHDLGSVRNRTGDGSNFGGNAVTFSGSNNNISYNRFYELWRTDKFYTYDGGAVEFYGSVSGKTNSNTVSYNYAYDVDGFMESGSGSTSDSCAHNTIAYNQVINSRKMIYMHNGGDGFSEIQYDWKFYNNNFVENKDQYEATAYAFGSSTTAISGTLVIKNNIFYVNRSTLTLYKSTFNPTHQNNIYRLDKGTLGLTIGASEQSFTSSDKLWTSMNDEANYWDYNLDKSSTAIDFGQSLGFAKDFNNNKINSSPDVGALEFYPTRFGVLPNGSMFSNAQKAHIVKSLNKQYVRVAINAYNFTGTSNLYQAYLDSGLIPVLTLNYLTTSGAAPFPTNMTTYSTAVTNVLNVYHPELMNVENEEINPNFHTGTMAQYGNMLNYAAGIAHSKGIKVTNGGVYGLGLDVLVIRWLEAQGRTADANQYKNEALYPAQRTSVDNPGSDADLEYKTSQVDTILGYVTSYCDYVNVHPYEPYPPNLSAAQQAAYAATTPNILAFIKQYCEFRTGKPCISNEWGQRNNMQPSLITSMMNEFYNLGYRYALEFDGYGSGGAKPLNDTITGALYPNGEAFRDFQAIKVVTPTIDTFGFWGYQQVDVGNFNTFNGYDVKGMHLIVPWSLVKPTYAGAYDWSTLNKALDTAIARNVYVIFQTQVGQNAPAWIFDSCGSFTTHSTTQTGPYPDYYGINYKKFFSQFLKDFASYLAGLSADRKARVVAWQISEGSTGDTGPYKGILDASYVNVDTIPQQQGANSFGLDWTSFRHNAWDTAALSSGYQSVKNNIALMLNAGNDGSDVGYVIGQDSLNVQGDEQGYIESHFSYLPILPWMKEGNASHEYAFRGEKSYFSRVTPPSRGEVQGAIKTSAHMHKDLWTLVMSALTDGLKILNGDQGWVNVMTLGDKRFSDFFTKMTNTNSEGCWMPAFKVDYGDTILFPSYKYGALIDPAKYDKFQKRLYNYNSQVVSLQGNNDYIEWLYWKAVEDYINPARAAAIDALYPTAGGASDTLYNRDHTVNAVYSYEKNLHLVNDKNVMVPFFRQGPDTSIYGRYAAEPLLDANNQCTWYFDIGDNLSYFSNSDSVEVDITYLDNGSGGSMSVSCIRCSKVTCGDTTTVSTNTGQWLTKKVQIPNFKWHPNGWDFMIDFTGPVRIGFVQVINLTKESTGGASAQKSF